VFNRSASSSRQTDRCTLLTIMTKHVYYGYVQKPVSYQQLYEHDHDNDDRSTDLYLYKVDGLITCECQDWVDDSLFVRQLDHDKVPRK